MNGQSSHYRKIIIQQPVNSILAFPGCVLDIPTNIPQVDLNIINLKLGTYLFVKQGFICKRLEKLETLTAETICIELIIKKASGLSCSLIDQKV